MTTETSRQRLLQLAISKYGSSHVAKHLSTTGETLQVWLNGLATMPDSKLLRLVDMIEKRKH